MLALPRFLAALRGVADPPERGLRVTDTDWVALQPTSVQPLESLKLTVQGRFTSGDLGERHLATRRAATGPKCPLR